VSANQISDKMTLAFTVAKYYLLDSKWETIKTPNVLNNIGIIQTDKTFRDYFSTLDFQRKKVEVDHLGVHFPWMQ
jgi:hypothetical protein